MESQLDDEEGSGHSGKSIYLVIIPKIKYENEYSSENNLIQVDFKKKSKLEKKAEEQERIFDPIDPDNFKFFTVSDNPLDKVAANPNNRYEKAGIYNIVKFVRLLAEEKRYAA